MQATLRMSGVFTDEESSEKFTSFGGVPSGPACSPVGILPLLLGAFGERACLRGVALLVVSAFAQLLVGSRFAGETLFCW